MRLNITNPNPNWIVVGRAKKAYKFYNQAWDLYGLRKSWIISSFSMQNFDSRIC